MIIGKILRLGTWSTFCQIKNDSALCPSWRYKDWRSWVICRSSDRSTSDQIHNIHYTMNWWLTLPICFFKSMPVGKFRPHSEQELNGSSRFCFLELLLLMVTVATNCSPLFTFAALAWVKFIASWWLVQLWFSVEDCEDGWDWLLHMAFNWWLCFSICLFNSLEVANSCEQLWQNKRILAFCWLLLEAFCWL